MADDRQGRSPRPGGRAPWERYPAANEPDRDGAHTSRRSRHSDEADDASAPLTVHDLVQKVDSERIARRRRPEPERRPEPRQNPPERRPGASSVARDIAASAPAPGRPTPPDAPARAPEAGRGAPPREDTGRAPRRPAEPGRSPAPGRPDTGRTPASGRAPVPAPPAPDAPRPGRPTGVPGRPADPSRPAPDAARAPGHPADTGRPAPDASRAPGRPGEAHRAPDASPTPGRPADPGRTPDASRAPGRPADPNRAPDTSRAPGRPADANRAPDAAQPTRSPDALRGKDAPRARGADAAGDAGRTPSGTAPRTGDAEDSATLAAAARSRRGGKRDKRNRPPEKPRVPLAQESPEAVTEEIPPVDSDEPQRPGESWPSTEGSKRTRSKDRKPRSVGPKKAGATAAPNKKLRTALRSSAVAFAVLALLVTGGGWSYLRSTDNGFTQVNALDDNPDDVLDSDLQLGDENFLIVGTDTRAGVNGEIGAGTLADAEGARADTVMLVNIPKNRSRVVVVSFPRDLDVTRPQCAGWDNDKGTYTEEQFPSAMGDKLNAVYALGGPKCLVNVIRKMTGLSINRFIGVDFAGFEAMVDQVGGVEVCTTKPIIDATLGTVLETSGTQRVSGQTALNYVRARHVYGEERSDYDRINRQQRFLASLLRGALSSKVLLDPGKLNGFVSAFTDHTFVDNVRSQDLLMLGRSLQKVSAGAVTFLTIPTAGTTSYGNEIPRESDIKALFRAIIDDQPLPGEQKAPEITAPGEDDAPAAPEPPTSSLTAVDPSIVSIQVSNASGAPGAAGSAATRLSNQGFGIYTTGNYLGGSSTTTKVRYASGHEAEAATVASAIPGASLEPAEELGSIVELVLGEDFSGTVLPPTSVGSTLPSVPIGTPASSPVALPSDLEHMNAADDTCK